MLKGQSIIGKKVLSRMDGERLDSVRDIVISKDHSRIVALILDEGGLFSAATAVAMENVVSFGKDAVVITDSKAVRRVDQFPEVKEIMDDRDSLVGKHIFTESGDQMGKVEDVFFDESTGTITTLEVGGKIVPTARNASAELEMGDIVSIGPDAVIIKMEAIPKLSAQASGTPVPDVQPSPDTTQTQTTPDSDPNNPPSGILDEQSLMAMASSSAGASTPTATDAKPSLSAMPPTSPLPPTTGDGDQAVQQAKDSDDRGDDVRPPVVGSAIDPTAGDEGKARGLTGES